MKDHAPYQTPDHGAGARRVPGAAVYEHGRDEQPFFGGCFAIFGHGNVAGLGQALLQSQDRLRVYLPRNEQAMVHAAVGFAKMANRRRAFVCTSSIGPGATNMVTGAALATINRLPVLLLPGDIFATRGPAPVLQQLESPAPQDVSVNDCFKPVSRTGIESTGRPVPAPLQTVETAPHIAGAQAQIHAHAGRQVDHPRTASSTIRSVAASAWLVIRSRSPFLSTNSSAVLPLSVSEDLGCSRANRTGPVSRSRFRQ